MLQLLLLLPFILVSILSMTFDISVDELSNANRGNFFHYDILREDARSHAQQRAIQLNLILTSNAEFDFMPECSTSREDEIQPTDGWSTSEDLDEVIDSIINEYKQSKTDNMKVKPLKDNINTICPQHLWKIRFEGKIIHPQIYQYLQRKRTPNRRWKPPV